MTDVLTTFALSDGGRVEIRYDNDPSPDDDPVRGDVADDLQPFAFSMAHRRYTLGSRETPEVDAAIERWGHSGRSLERVRRYLRMFHGTEVFLVLGMTDHSSITIYDLGPDVRLAFASTAQSWDSGVVGFLYDTAERREHTGMRLDTSEDRATWLYAWLTAAQLEIKTYAAWLRREVYGLLRFDAYGAEIDEVWGLFGYASHRAIVEAYCADVTITGES